MALFLMSSGFARLWVCASRCLDSRPACFFGEGLDEVAFEFGPSLWFPFSILILDFHPYLFNFFFMQYSQTAVIPRASILVSEAEWLKSINADLVVCATLHLFLLPILSNGYSQCVKTLMTVFLG